MSEKGLVAVASPQIVRGRDGDFTVDAEALAARFGLPVERLRSQMRRALVSSTVETGQGPDGGTWRLTVRNGNRFWRAVVDAEGRVQAEENGFSAARPARR